MEGRDTQAVQLGHANDQERAHEAFAPSGLRLAESRWGTTHKVAFRFAFSYLFLYLFPLSGTLAWLWSGLPKPVATYETLWHKTVVWFAAHILSLRYPITIFPEVNGGSDTTYDYVKSLCFVLIAALATVVWSLMDRNGLTYSKLDQWLRVYVRVVLAFALLSYGGGKLIPTQMPPPSLSTLMQPFGDLTPYRLSWSFIGASTGYEIFCGAVEVLGGVLLLIPGTTMLGALVSLGAMGNVFMLNMCYGIPVKFWAGHLILFATFLLLPDVRRLVNLFVLNRTAEPEPRPALFRRRWMNYSVWGIQWALGIYLIVITLSGASTGRQQVNSMPLTNPLYGIWSVDEFTADGQVHPPLLTDNLRWQRLIFNSNQTLTIQEMNGRFSSYAAAMDTHKNTLLLKGIKTAVTSSPWWSEWHLGPVTYDAAPRWRADMELSYSRPQADAMILEGLMNGHRLRVTLKKEERQFVLKTLGFRWVNDEYDLFNDFADEINRVP
jgi:hypothetical protein